MKERYGCLALLFVFAAIVAPGVWFARDPGKSSALAVGGFFGLAIIYVHSGVEWLAGKRDGRRKSDSSSGGRPPDRTA